MTTAPNPRDLTAITYRDLKAAVANLPHKTDITGANDPDHDTAADMQRSIEAAIKAVAAYVSTIVADAAYHGYEVGSEMSDRAGDHDIYVRLYEDEDAPRVDHNREHSTLNSVQQFGRAA